MTSPSDPTPSVPTVGEARPCPWCGSTVTPVQRETDGAKWGALCCAECGAVGPEVRTGYGKPETWYAAALAEWNKRPALDALVAAVRAETVEVTDAMVEAAIVQELSTYQPKQADKFRASETLMAQCRTFYRAILTAALATVRAGGTA